MPRKEVPNNNNAQKKSKKGFFSRLFRKMTKRRKGRRIHLSKRLLPQS